jgi:hypothetical protein
VTSSSTTSKKVVSPSAPDEGVEVALGVHVGGVRACGAGQPGREDPGQPTLRHLVSGA